MKRENVVGRANVEDTPELEAYYRALEGEELGALWNVANEIEPWYPQPKSVPTHLEVEAKSNPTCARRRSWSRPRRPRAA